MIHSRLLPARFIFVLTAFLLCTRVLAQKDAQKQPEAPVYDSVLAKKLGADQYGMKKYVLAFLKRGPVKISDSTERAKLQMGHMENIQRMADLGKLVLAGPFLDKQDIRGIYIFNVETIEEAQQLTETDPAIKAGTLVMELHPWYGSAALMQVVSTHSTLSKEKP